MFKLRNFLIGEGILVVVLFVAEIFNTLLSQTIDPPIDIYRGCSVGLIFFTNTIGGRIMALSCLIGWMSVTIVGVILVYFLLFISVKIWRKIKNKAA